MARSHGSHEYRICSVCRYTLSADTLSSVRGQIVGGLVGLLGECHQIWRLCWCVQWRSMSYPRSISHNGLPLDLLLITNWSSLGRLCMRRHWWRWIVIAVLSHMDRQWIIIGYSHRFHCYQQISIDTNGSTLSPMVPLSVITLLWPFWPRHLMAPFTPFKCFHW